MNKKRLLLAENVSVYLGPRLLFRIAKLEVYEGDRIGLVGVNGCGKTTLLQLLAKKILPDEGEIKIECTPRYFEQVSHDTFWTSNQREQSLFGVQNLIEQDEVSGGEETRLRLAELFSEDSALFLLDEPTSHLDMKGWEYLNHRLSLIQSFILVSHDRELLNRQCNRIIEIENKELRQFSGNYSSYCEQKRLEQQRASFEYEQYMEEMNRLSMAYKAKKEKAKKAGKKPKKMSSSEAKARDFCAVGRSFNQKSKSIDKSAENIKKRMEHMEVKLQPAQIPKIRPMFSLTEPPQNAVILEAQNLCFSYPNGKEIFRNANFQLLKGSHTVLLGENGAGKTTLLQMILKRQQIRVVPKANIGYLQQNLGNLCPDKTVLESAMEMSVQPMNVVRTILARLLFTADDIKKAVAVLSGGERIRLAFARIFVSNANVLILDEPTNYLDIPSVEAIQQLLTEYEGTLLFVSHDRAFVKAIATDSLTIRDKQIFYQSIVAE